MIKINLFLAAILLTCYSFGQQPVHWNYYSRKLNDTTYELHLKAKIEEPWHIYAQDNSADVTSPTKINFTNNPLVRIAGNLKESGSLISKRDLVSGNILNYYSHNVEFVQIVSLKTKVKTRLTGTIEFMACTDTKCLPPEELNFSIPLDGRQ